ncbi:MAG: transglutaminase domain-containing protein [Deltaproteobacteria bacterium]|nr:transglutaminase domain-containing protein [Deltaproteobacteria bacterium]
MDKKYLLPTAIIDSDHEDVIAFAAESTAAAENDPVRKAVLLYYAVRDGIWYDPYYPFYLPEHYRASNVLESERGYCVCKASLLCALARACGIPARVGFADVRNHLATKQLIDFFGSDIFVYHGFTDFYLGGKWVRATPAFNLELCEKHKVPPLEFNGREDSLFHAYNEDKKQFMEYLTYHDSYADIPVDTIVEAWKAEYGKDRIEKWIEHLEKTGGMSLRDFMKEDVVK